MQTICYGWLVYQLTHSRFLLGLVGFIGAAPLFGLTLFGGAIADRHDKKRVLFLTQSFFAATALTLGLLVQLKVVNIYHIIAIAFMNGLCMAVDAPIRQTMPACLVARKDLTAAIALNSAAFNSARVIGPSAAGLVVLKLSMAWCFYINAISYLGVIAALLAIRADTAPKAGLEGATVWSDFVSGLRYIRNEPRIRTLILMAIVPSLFVMPYAMLMLIISRDILHAGLDGYGHIMSATGIGALLGALTLAQLSRARGKGIMLLGSAVLDAVMLILAAHARSLLLAEFYMLGVGFCSVFYNSSTNTLIQSIAPDAFRGRATSGFVFAMLGLSPLASLQAGSVAQALGAPAAMTLGGVIFGAMALAVAATQRRIREL